MLPRILRQHGLRVVVADLRWCDADAHAETLFDEAQHLHPLAPAQHQRGLREAVGSQKFVPARSRGAALLPALRDVFAQTVELLLHIRIGDRIIGLQLGLLQDQVAIDQPLDGLVARLILAGITERLKGRQPHLFIDITIEHQVAIHNGNDAVEVSILRRG